MTVTFHNIFDEYVIKNVDFDIKCVIIPISGSILVSLFKEGGRKIE